MTTGLTYSQYVTQIATLAVVEESNSEFVTILPQMITYAENRIYRDLDFLFTSISNSSYYVSAGTRKINVPAGTFVVPEQINVLLPPGTSNPESAIRVALTPCTKEFLDAVYGSGGSYGDRGVPKYFCPFDDYTFLVGPYANYLYYVEIIGTYRPASLSSSNPTTFISLYLPDLMIMASMIYISGYQRNFGRANDDPQMAVTYESQYQVLLKGAMAEENRKKFEAAAWSSQSQSVTASPTRG